jgi:hypothetical protein
MTRKRVHTEKSTVDATASAPRERTNQRRFAKEFAPARIFARPIDTSEYLRRLSRALVGALIARVLDDSK